ncbi:MAG: hypothetical protein KGJ42_02555 [Acidobacteriota bacterium]|nr:hypothetical protein [Acidobacteriota bacterium]
MTGRNRWGALVIAVVALALTATGVVWSLTDSNPTGLAKDPFALNGYPPKSAQLALRVTTGQGAALSATLNVNFHRDAIEALVQFPMVFTSINEDVRVVNGQVYLRSANVANGPWLSMPLKSPNLFGLSLELVRPDVALITGLNKSVRKNGYETIYTFTRHDVALNPLTGATTSTLGSVKLTITTGAYGEAVASTLVLSTGRRVTTIALNVLSYNQTVNVVAPARRDVRPLPSSLLKSLTGSLARSGVVVPNLGQITSGTAA